MNPTWYFAARFLTGAGIGGEYAAINSAIDELIPAKYRGRVDVAINGSFWVGAAVGALLTIPLLDPDRRQPGARLAARLRPRRDPRRRHPARAPQRARRARAGCSSTAARTRARRSSATSSATVARGDRPRPASASRTRSRSGSARRSASPLIAKTVFTMYPKRTVLCFSLFVGPGVPLQRVLLHLRRHPDDVPRRQADRLVHRGLRGQQLRSAPCCSSPLFDTRRPGQDDHRHLRRSPACCSASPGFLLGSLTADDADPVRRGHLLLRLGRRQRGVPHRQRGLPDGDAGAVHRVLLRDRHRGRRHHRPAALRQADRQRRRPAGTSPASRPATSSAPR